MSEWPRSKFQASAVRQRRNFGHRNRIIGPCGGYGSCASPVRVVREADPYGIITGNAATKAKQAADPRWASRLFFRKRREKHFVRE